MKKLLILLFLSFATFKSNQVVAQCAGFCGGFAGFCFCDDACWLFGDCCPDMCASCPGIGPNTIANCGTPPPPPPSCVAAPVTGPCYQLVIFTDPTCCDVAWSPACQDLYDNCVEVTPGPGWVVPDCVTELYIEAGGGSGGGPNGGQGAQIYGTIPVNPGDVVDVVNGTQGALGAGGVPGGGTGAMASTPANSAYGGGGATTISINGTVVLIAGAGGGQSGGNTDQGGGDGGCNSGTPAPGWSFGAPGQPGTQTAGGAGGGPWGGGNAGTSGSYLQGGNGAVDPCYNLGPGGGGGAGYYGGGGGGSDCFPAGSLGGGSGGGGSSLIPAGMSCEPGGADLGDGETEVAYFVGSILAEISDDIICEGETVTLELIGATGAVQWQTAPSDLGPWTNIPGGTTAVFETAALTADACFRAEETGGSCSPTPYSNIVCVTVNTAPNPFAGLDDSLCHSTTVGYVLQGVPAGTGTTTWSQFAGPTGTPSPPNTVYSPSSSNPGATILVNHPGAYTYILSETDPTGVCPPAKDTVVIFFAKENHTTTFTNPVCNGSSDGSITVTSTGNVGANQYSFDGGTTYQASNTSGLTLPAGTYTVISMDPVGCTFQSTVDLVDPAPVVVSVSNDTTVCENGTATVSASATGGTSYDYHWSMTADLGAVQTVSPTIPETVSVFAENEFGCTSTPLDITISLYDPISLVITPNDTICPGDASSHTVTASGGHLGYNYAWTANGTAIGSVTNSVSVNPTVNTEYCVTVSDGCETDPVNICVNTIMREVPNPIFTSDTTEGCVPAEINFTNLTTMTAPSYVDSITWIIEGVMYHTADITHHFENVGSYDVFLEIYSNYGCHNSMTAGDYITIHAAPEAMFYANPNPTTVFNTEIDFNNTSTPGANTYYWTFPGGAPANSGEENPTVIYPQGIATQYPVELIVINEYNCPDTVEGIVDIQSDIILYAPNAFTPDGDEFNETWRVYIEGIDIYDFHLTVYNRWGEIVWESYNPEGAWNGTYGSTQAKQGTYVWVIEAKDKFSDKKLEWRGHVTVLK